jgi:hypothetical protein
MRELESTLEGKEIGLETHIWWMKARKCTQKKINRARKWIIRYVMARKYTQEKTDRVRKRIIRYVRAKNTLKRKYIEFIKKNMIFMKK